jgi:acid phosphatase family membrane protein YuiD
VSLYKYLIVILLAWMVAHIIKALLMRKATISTGEPYNFFRSGGMPSSHTATVVALTTLIGATEGITSPIFALSALFALVVMRDACGVRYMAGESAEALGQLIKASKSKIKQPRIVPGHTVSEVAGGAIVGLAIGLIVFLTTN